MYPAKADAQEPNKGNTDDELFHFLAWTPLSPEQPGIKALIRDYQRPDHDIGVHSAALAFYRTFKLLRVALVNRTTGSARCAYALYRHHLETGKLELHSLDGTSAPIHAINALNGELDLHEATADEYLRFFSSAVHSEHGSFSTIPSGFFHRLKEHERKQFQNFEDEVKLQKVEGSPYPLRVTPPESKIAPRVAGILYGSTLFRAWFVVPGSAEPNAGTVNMVDDQPLLSELEPNLPTYRNGRLFVLVRPLREPLAPIHHFLREWKGTETDDADGKTLVARLTRDTASPNKAVPS